VVIILKNPLSGSATGKMTAKNDNAELQQFYYHPDHLGSSSYISNLDGEVVQHVEYVPFGEVFLEEKNSKWNTPYLFTSKELDRETGMYYFSARYQDPKLGIFLGVDPKAEKYVGWSSYAYALNNPVKFIDPTGMSAEDGEYDLTHDKNGKEVKTKISNLGDADGIDFIHNMDGANKGHTQIVNTKTGTKNWITDGVKLIRGYTQRNNSTNWSSIFSEWKEGTGPQNSLIFGRNSSINKSIRTSNLFGAARNNYLEKQAFDSEGKISKGSELVSFANYLPALYAAAVSGKNMAMQMLGTANVSFYNIGNYQRLVLITDSKSVESFNRLGTIGGYGFSDFIGNPARDTRQTYMWIDNNTEE
jgi:RHS repeat-associated protein